MNSNTQQQVALTRLRAKFPWPDVKPSVPCDPHGWFGHDNVAILSRLLTSETGLVIELGSWLGLSTRWMLNHTLNATLIAIDTWLGSVEYYTPVSQADHEGAPRLPQLHETFLANCWEYRQRLIPIRLPTLAGLQVVSLIADSVGDGALRPDVIYVDADHQELAVAADVLACRRYFPGATLVGDDADYPGVLAAINRLHCDEDFDIQIIGRVWTLAPSETS